MFRGAEKNCLKIRTEPVKTTIVRQFDTVPGQRAAARISFSSTRKYFSYFSTAPYTGPAQGCVNRHIRPRPSAVYAAQKLDDWLLK